MVENGKREPKLSLITTLAAELDIPVAALLSQEPPTRRAWLEVAVERAQEEPMYQGSTCLASNRPPRFQTRSSSIWWRSTTS